MSKDGELPAGERFTPPVLLVCAQAAARAALRAMIEDGGYPLVEAAAPDEALARLAQDLPDLVLIDTRDPELDGLALCCTMRAAATDPGLPILLIARGEDDAALNAVFDAGATDYIASPIHRTALCYRLRYLLEHRAMTRRVREDAERYRIVSSVISDYAYSYIVTPEGELVKDWVTDAFSRIIGFDPTRAKEEGFIKFIHPDDLPIAMARGERLLRGEPDISEFRIVTNSGAVRWIRDHGYPVVDEVSGRVTRLYGAAQDITPRREAEEALRRYADELTSRNRELDAFAHTVAHDLKNPLASMMGFASVVHNYYDRMTRDEIRDNMQAIMDSVYKMRSIINSLLVLAGVNKMTQVELRPLDMASIVEEAQRTMSYMIQEQRAEIILPESWHAAHGYKPWVEEVWANYMSNAIKYGGRPPRLELGSEVQDDGMVRFWVRDNGSGLTADEQGQLFTPFTRLTQIVGLEGHGLGLSVVQRIIERLGGTVGVESEPGAGSVFSFTLPGTPDAARRANGR